MEFKLIDGVLFYDGKRVIAHSHISDDMIYVFGSECLVSYKTYHGYMKLFQDKKWVLYYGI